MPCPEDGKELTLYCSDYPQEPATSANLPIGLWIKWVAEHPTMSIHKKFSNVQKMLMFESERDAVKVGPNEHRASLLLLKSYNIANGEKVFTTNASTVNLARNECNLNALAWLVVSILRYPQLQFH